MQLKSGTFCPLVQGECKQLECAWFTKVVGSNPNTGQEVDEWNCAVALLPMLVIEGAKESRQTGAAVESFRNETVNSGAAMMGLIASAAQNRLNQAP
jgi:hypothetical protein